MLSSCWSQLPVLPRSVEYGDGDGVGPHEQRPQPPVGVPMYWDFEVIDPEPRPPRAEGLGWALEAT